MRAPQGKTNLCLSQSATQQLKLWLCTPHIDMSESSQLCCNIISPITCFLIAKHFVQSYINLNTGMYSPGYDYDAQTAETGHTSDISHFPKWFTPPKKQKQNNVCNLRLFPTAIMDPLPSWRNIKSGKTASALCKWINKQDVDQFSGIFSRRVSRLLCSRSLFDIKRRL